MAMYLGTIEDLMPQGHFLRKLEAALDLSFMYEETDHLYSKCFGRPPIDPVVIVKYLLVGFLYGIPSERQIEQRIETDIAAIGATLGSRFSSDRSRFMAARTQN